MSLSTRSRSQVNHRFSKIRKKFSFGKNPRIWQNSTLVSEMREIFWNFSPETLKLRKEQKITFEKTRLFHWVFVNNSMGLHFSTIILCITHWPFLNYENIFARKSFLRLLLFSLSQKVQVHHTQYALTVFWWYSQVSECAYNLSGNYHNYSTIKREQLPSADKNGDVTWGNSEKKVRGPTNLILLNHCSSMQPKMGSSFEWRMKRRRTKKPRGLN